MLTEVDAALKAALAAAEAEDPEVWSCPNRVRRESAHALFQYPAMMVPKVQRRLIAAVHSVQPDVYSVYDPFVGAATALVAAMPLGVSCHGCDINPLAILVSRVKMHPMAGATVRQEIGRVVRCAHLDTSTQPAASFRGIDKWFTREAVTAISRLVRPIRETECPHTRRFLWVALAETVRLTSNDRTSTFKLHARPADEIAKRIVGPITTFEEIAQRNVADVESHRLTLERTGQLGADGYTAAVELHLADSATLAPPPAGYDLLVTSPPYGDNATTVTYGQYSYLPLQWIDFNDIHPDADREYLRSTHEIDKRSLGGRVSTRGLSEVAEPLRARSPALAATLDALVGEPKRLPAKVVSFYKDLDRVLEHAVAMLKPNAYMIWTVGNRMVGGVQVPTDNIISDLLSTHGAMEVVRLGRDIHHKRMPTRNKSTTTMDSETILVLRKQGAAAGRI